MRGEGGGQHAEPRWERGQRRGRKGRPKHHLVSCMATAARVGQVRRLLGVRMGAGRKTVVTGR
jgi:hypothetical protein